MLGDFQKVENAIPHDYSCVMLKVCEELSYKIRTLNILRKDIYNPDGTYGRETDPHITVLYGIHTGNINNISTAINCFPKANVRFTLDGISLFENEDYDVLKIGVRSYDLYLFNEILSDNLISKNTYPDYNPHITIAYLKSGTGRKYLGRSVFNGDKHSSNKLEISMANSFDKYKCNLL